MQEKLASYWNERQHGQLDLYVDGTLRACVDYFAGSAVVFPHGGKDGIKIVAPWSKDIFSIVEVSVGIERVSEIRYPPIERTDWRSLAEGRTKQVARSYGRSGEFDYFIECACISLNGRGEPGSQKRVRKTRLRAASAKALDALLRARRALKWERGQASAVSSLEEARRCLEAIPGGKILGYEALALSEIKMALASARAGKCLREPLSGDEAAALSNVIAGIEPPF
jgi:hypothetical protein